MSYEKVLISAKYKILSELVLNKNKNTLILIDTVIEEFSKNRKINNIEDDLKIDLFDFIDDLQGNMLFNP